MCCPARDVTGTALFPFKHIVHSDFWMLSASRRNEERNLGGIDAGGCSA